MQRVGDSRKETGRAIQTINSNRVLGSVLTLFSKVRGVLFENFRPFIKGGFIPFSNSRKSYLCGRDKRSELGVYEPTCYFPFSWFLFCKVSVEYILIFNLCNNLLLGCIEVWAPFVTKTSLMGNNGNNLPHLKGLD